MSGFERNFKHVIEFDGDSVEFTLTGLTRKDVILLTPLFVKVSEDISEEDANTLASAFINVVKPHIEGMTGLKDKQGNAIDVDTMIENQYFFKLSSGIANYLMEKSNPVAKEEVAKKPEESSPITSTPES